MPQAATAIPHRNCCGSAACRAAHLALGRHTLSLLSSSCYQSGLRWHWLLSKVQLGEPGLSFPLVGSKNDPHLPPPARIRRTWQSKMKAFAAGQKLRAVRPAIAQSAQGRMGELC